MKTMMTLLITLLTVNLVANDSASLEKTLNEFLLGASINNHQVHEQFWADELIYTSSNGTRFDKAFLMTNVKSSVPIKLSDATLVYSQESLKVNLMDDLAIINFTLVASDPRTKKVTQHYLNSGVMVWRDNRWQAINWHATKMDSEPGAD